MQAATALLAKVIHTTVVFYIVFVRCSLSSIVRFSIIVRNIEKVIGLGEPKTFAIKKGLFVLGVSPRIRDDMKRPTSLKSV